MDQVFALGALVLVVVIIAMFARSRRAGAGGDVAPPRFPPGTRAFESEMSLRILSDMMAARERQLAGSPDDATRATLEKQLENLRKQRKLHQAVVDRMDVSKGKMSIGVNPDADTID